MSDPSGFYLAALYQRTCAVCGSTGDFEAHHVLSKQALKRRGLDHLLWDGRNALRLCEGLDTNKCHHKLRVPTEKLRDENVCFIWEALGVAGQNYLERHYTGIDRRYTLHTTKDCPLCQRQPQKPPA